MVNSNEAKIIILKNLKCKYLNCYNFITPIINKSNKILMSKSFKTSLYGAFYPTNIMNNFCIYEGIETKTIDNSDFLYYFYNDKLELTIRKYNINDVYYIFYFYNEKSIDVVWYSDRRKMINIVGQIELINKNECILLESNDSKEISGYKEYHFNITKNEIVETIYEKGFLPDNKDYFKTSNFKKINI